MLRTVATLAAQGQLGIRTERIEECLYRLGVARCRKGRLPAFALADPDGFQAAQGMKQTDWSKQASNRVAGPESLSGRHRMREALAHLGIQAE